MADEVLLKRAKVVYDTICKALDSEGWKYSKDEGNFAITTGAKGDDLPIDMLFLIDVDAQVVTLYSPFQIKANEDCRVEVAMATCVLNDSLLHGSFDFNLGDGNIRFRMTTSYMGSILGEDVFKYMAYTGAGTVDRYNEKIAALATGVIDLNQFLDLLSKEEE